MGHMRLRSITQYYVGLTYHLLSAITTINRASTATSTKHAHAFIQHLHASTDHLLACTKQLQAFTEQAITEDLDESITLLTTFTEHAPGGYNHVVDTHQAFTNVYEAFTQHLLNIYQQPLST